MDTQNKEQQELDDHERYQREFERLERECCEITGRNRRPTRGAWEAEYDPAAHRGARADQTG